VSLAVCVGWLCQTKLGLGVRGQWLITPHQWWPIGAWGLPLVVLFLFGGMAALSAYDCFVRAKSPKESRQSAGLSVGALALFALLWPWFLLGPGGTSNLVSATFSDVSNQYFAAAWRMDGAREFTGSYSQKQQYPESVMLAHVATHPPGAVLFYYSARRVYEKLPFLKSTFEGFARWQTNEDIASLALTANASRRTAARVAGAESASTDLPLDAVGGAIWSAFLLSLAAALCVPAVFLLAGMGENDIRLQRCRGLLAAALFAIAPALGLFTFTIDVLIAAGVLWALVLMALGLRENGNSQKYFWLAASGFLVALSSFISFGALVVWAVIGIVLMWRKQHFPARLGAVILGFIAGWILLKVLFPMHLAAIFTQAMAAHRYATLQSRSWSLWVWINIIIFAIFTGLPLWWMSLCSALGAMRQKYFSIAMQIGMAALAAMILVSLSGNARGEVERLWLFLIAPLAVLAAQWISAVPTRKGVYAIIALLGAACLQTLLMAAALGPLVRPF